MILSFDQTVANSGWCLAEVIDGALHIRTVGTLRTPVSHEGHIGTIKRARKLYTMYKALLESNREDLTYIVHELPSLGGKTFRSESSLVAASVLYAAIEDVVPEVPIVVEQNQHMKKVVAGSAKVSKAELARAIADDPMIHIPTNKLNEHIRDAIGLARAAVLDGKIKW